MNIQADNHASGADGAKTEVLRKGTADMKLI